MAPPAGPVYTLAMPLVFTTSHIDDSRALFAQYKKLAERTIAQVSDEHLVTAIDPEANSIAIVMKHMAGNMLSRWTDFLTSDGEKPTRHRDQEFENPPATRAELLALWESAWATLFSALEPLTDSDLTRTVTIRGEAHSVLQAINRQIAHYAMHTGQIVLLAKHFAGPHWQTLSIARGASSAFNRKVVAGEASQR